MREDEAAKENAWHTTRRPKNNIKGSILKNIPGVVKTGASNAVDVIAEMKMQDTQMQEKIEVILKGLALLKNGKTNSMVETKPTVQRRRLDENRRKVP